MHARIITTTLSLTLLAVPALAADTSKTYTSGILVLLFVGFCALLVVLQLLPAVLNLFNLTRKAAQQPSKQQVAVKN